MNKCPHCDKDIPPYGPSREQIIEECVQALEKAHNAAALPGIEIHPLRNAILALKETATPSRY